MRNPVFKKSWWLIGLLLLVAALLGYRVWWARKAPAAVAVATPSSKPSLPVELADTDVLTVTPRALAVGLPLSGTLRASNSAYLKARVAGELQGLQVREGDTVKGGQVLARVDPTEYASRERQAREQAESAKAQVDIAQRQYDNNKALVAQGFISQTALDTSLSSLASAQANYKAALAALDVSSKAMDDTVLRAPITGLVSQRLAQPGERVAVDARILEIVDLSRLEVEASLSPADSVQVRVGQPALLQVEGNSQALTARVVRISPAAQAGSRSVLVYLQVDKPDGLRQGLYVQGQLGLAQRSVLAVPVSAVRTDKPGPYLVVIENGLVSHRPVTLGERGEANGEAMVAIKSGVPENARVVGGGIAVLREGTAVRFTVDQLANAGAK